jgi:hypothetical protein
MVRRATGDFETPPGMSKQAEGGTMSRPLDFSKPGVLRTEGEHSVAVAEIDALLDAEPAEGSETNDRLEFLSVLVAAYEAHHSASASEGRSPPKSSARQ